MAYNFDASTPSIDDTDYPSKVNTVFELLDTIFNTAASFDGTVAINTSLNVGGSNFGVTGSTGNTTMAGTLVLGGAAVPVLNGKLTSSFDGAAKNGVVLNETNNTSAGGFAIFALNGVQIGSITRNAATSAVLFNTTSDYRVKTTFGAYSDAYELLSNLFVHDGIYNGDERHRPLILAHESQPYTPWAVTGEKDAQDESGNPIYQQMDYTSYVPLLVAGWKQHEARIAQLEQLAGV